MGTHAWLAFCVFPMQLYADFSGLTDIAIGSGLLFGKNLLPVIAIRRFDRSTHEAELLGLVVGVDVEEAVAMVDVVLLGYFEWRPPRW